MRIQKANSDDTQQHKARADFQRAAIQAHDLARQGFSASIFAAVLLLFAVIANTFGMSPIWVAFFCTNAAALILFGAGLRCAYEVAEWRRKKAGLASIRLGKLAQWIIAFMTSP